MSGPLDGGGRGEPDEPDGVRGIPRIPAQRAAADDLDPPATAALRRAIDTAARAAQTAKESREREDRDETNEADANDDTDAGAGGDATGDAVAEGGPAAAAGEAGATTADAGATAATTGDQGDRPADAAAAGVGSAAAADGNDAGTATADAGVATADAGKGDPAADAGAGTADAGAAGAHGDPADDANNAGATTAAAGVPGATAATAGSAGDPADDANGAGRAGEPTIDVTGAALSRPREPAHPPDPDRGRDMSGRPRQQDVAPSHSVLKSLLGAWALAACSPEETVHVENHLTECAPCADEALKLRDAVGLLQTDRNLDLPPLLRSRVLETCLDRRAARIPVPVWATPYDAETARLDALLRDFGDAEWHAPLQLRWFEKEEPTARRATVAGVIGHLMTVDGLVASALGLDDPLGPAAPQSPTDRTEAFWRTAHPPPTRTIHEPWRAQSHELIRTVSFAGRGVAELSVSYGEFALPLRDALIDRAFECWIHGWDIAEAVDYPYPAPSGPHLRVMIDLAAQLLPSALAARRRAGLAAPARQLVVPGTPGRSLHLEVEGAGGGDWYIALDSPAAVGTAEHAVAQVALDGVEFCQLVAGHISPEEAAAGQGGDREAVRDVLSAAASLSRL